MSSLSSLQDTCQENGYKALEGEGTWIHWAIYDRSRLERLFQEAVAKLDVLHRHFDVRTDSEDGEVTCRLRRSAVKKKVSTCLCSGWKAYTDYNIDFEAGLTDSILDHLSRRRLVHTYMDTVLYQLQEIDIFLTASDSGRIQSTSRSGWLNRRSYDLKELYFIASEFLASRVRLYPSFARRIVIMFDERLTLKRCHTHICHLQSCLYLRILTIIFSAAVRESQLANLRSVLSETLVAREEGLTLSKQLKLILKFPLDCSRNLVKYTGYVLKYQTRLEVEIIIHEEVFDDRSILQWATAVGLYVKRD